MQKQQHQKKGKLFQKRLIDDMSAGVNRALARQGQKIWFPNIVFTLIKHDGPSTLACFRVPMNLNKLDIKNYLKSIYAIDALSVSTRIVQPSAAAQKTSKEGASTAAVVKAHKRAYVTLKEAFEWPGSIPFFFCCFFFFRPLHCGIICPSGCSMREMQNTEADPRWKPYLHRPQENEAREKQVIARDAYMRNMKTHATNPELMKRVKGPKPFGRRMLDA